MDSITHIFLGAAVAQIAWHWQMEFWAGVSYREDVSGRAAGCRCGFDLYTGEAVRDHALHRHFMHSLMVVPGLAFMALMPFMFFSRKARPNWKALYWASILACVTHTLLDSLTSYGAIIFWPFSFRRYALDIIPIVDPIYTIPLIVGVWPGVETASGAACVGRVAFFLPVSGVCDPSACARAQAA